MSSPTGQKDGLSPLAIALALGGAAVTWLVVDVLRRLL